MKDQKGGHRIARRAVIGGGLAAAGAVAITGGVLLARDGAAIVPGRSRARRVTGDARLPDAVDVVVVGGGNIGCMAALSLAERGHSVALFEKGVVAGEASGRSMGFIDSSFADPIKTPILHRSKQLWEGMTARLGSEVGYRRTGTLALFRKQADVDGVAHYAEAARASGMQTRMLDRRALDSVAPGLATPVAGGMFEPSDAMAEPQLFAPAVADALRRRKGMLFQNCAVRGIERTAGRISGVVTEKGRVACKAVIVAGGAWSPVFLRNLGVDLPQFMAFSSGVRLAPTGAAGPLPCIILADDSIVFRRNLAGGYDTAIALATAPLTPAIMANLPRLEPAITNMWSQVRPAINLSTFMREWRIPDRWALDARSPFEDNRILMPETRQAIVGGAIAGTAAAFPAIGRAAVTERWAGVLTSTLDNMPVISEIAGNPGLYVGSGFYFGLTMAPAAGEALADLVTGHGPAFDLSPYRHARFTDGSPIAFRG